MHITIQMPYVERSSDCSRQL